MRIRVLLTTIAIAFVGLAGPGVVAPAGASTHHPSAARHACTKTASGSCIQRGQKCSKALRGHVGWTADGSKVKCKGKKPHWRKVGASHPCRVAGSARATGCAIPPPSCTTTSSGSCIRGGEFCKQSEYGETGYDANGTVYTCTGDPNHPHWE